MKISLDHISKRFQRHWIIKNVDYTFSAPESYAILGANGSGKSTLLRIIAGIQSPTAGKLHYENAAKIEADKIFKHISFCAPSQEIVEELTLDEFLKFHYSFKTIYPGLIRDNIIEIMGLTDAKDKPIVDFSSGMKQRVKLAQAIFTDSPVLLLDEPCTNLDDDGVQQYTHWMNEYTQNKLVIIASNDKREYHFCKHQLKVADYK